MRDGGALPPGAHDDRRPDARARRLRQALRRARADLDPRAALSAACRATTRSRCAPTSSSAAPTRPSTCCSARDVQRAYGQPEQAVLTDADPARASTACEKMSKSLGNHIGVTEAPEEMYGRTLSLPDEAMDAWFALLAVERPPEGTAPARRQARARARDRRALPRRRTRRAAAEEHFDRVHRPATRRPRRSPSSRSPPATARCTCRRCSPTAFGVSRSEARRLLAQGGVKLDGEPLAADASTSPRDAPRRRACCRSASGSSAACASGLTAAAAVHAACCACGPPRDARRSRLASGAPRRAARASEPRADRRRRDTRAGYRACPRPCRTAGPPRMRGARSSKLSSIGAILDRSGPERSRSGRVRQRRRSPSRRARRSLKTQQHAHLDPFSDPVCVQVRPVRLASGPADQRLTRHRPRRPVYAAPHK